MARGNKPNYKAKILLNIIAGKLPCGSVQWKAVAESYQVAAGEAECRDVTDIKRYFFDKMCGKLKKPTGEAAPAKAIREGQDVYRKMLAKHASSSYGGNDDFPDEEEEEEEDDEDLEDDFDIAEDDSPTEVRAAVTSSVGTSSATTIAPDTTSAVEGFVGASFVEASSTMAATANVSSTGTGSRKRKSIVLAEDSKSKNSRPSNPRGSAAGAIQSLVCVMGANAGNATLFAMMKMQTEMHQQQIQAQMQAQQQTQQQMMMMMMMLMMNGGRPSNSAAIPTSSPLSTMNDASANALFSPSSSGVENHTEASDDA